jgi:hypothetical protein
MSFFITNETLFSLKKKKNKNLPCYANLSFESCRGIHGGRLVLVVASH